MKYDYSGSYGPGSGLSWRMNGHRVSKDGVSLYMHVDDNSLKRFVKEINSTIIAAGTEGHKTVSIAANTILNNSRMLVPKDTMTLHNSGYARVETVMAKTMRNAASDAPTPSESIFTAVVGYGDDSNGANPNTGEFPSTYAWEVHENLATKHKNGQAKFLETAFREYAMLNWPDQLIQLERTLYTHKRMSVKYSGKEKHVRFNTMEGHNYTAKDVISNYDRLAGIYSKATKGAKK